MAKIEIGKLDPAMATKPADTDGIAWHLPFEAPMKLYGFHWFDTDHAYERLPLDRPQMYTRYPNGVKTPTPIEQVGAISLSAHTAGGQVRFRTDSSRILVQGVLTATGGMDHMAFTGSAGFDIYLRCGNTWKCLGVTRTDHYKPEFATTIVDGLRREMRDVLLNFPLYNGLKNVSFGLDQDAKLEAPTPYANPHPIVLYGTSIDQGGCASRPGMASSNILSRMLDQEVLNLGFSGNGRGEPEIAKMLAAVRNPALYILDYAWNTSPKELAATLPGVIDIIRASHPDTPILTVSPSPGKACIDVFATPQTSFTERARTMQEEAEKRSKAGDKNIYFFDALHESQGEDFWECTVDGAHMTDLGFLRFAQAICPVIQKILA